MLRRMLHKCSYVHAPHKSTAFCTLILSEQLHVQMLCTEFDSNQTKSAESRVVIHFCPSVIYVLCVLAFAKLILHRQLFVQNSYTNFHENPRDCLVTDTRSHIDMFST